MSLESNKALVKDFMESAIHGVWHGTNEHFRDYLADDVVFHTPLLASADDHADALHEEVRGYSQAIANYDFHVDFMLAEGDLVSAHVIGNGEHHQAFSHPAGEVAASGKSIEAGTLMVVRIRDDKIAELWYYSNLADLLQVAASA